MANLRAVPENREEAGAVLNRVMCVWILWASMKGFAVAWVDGNAVSLSAMALLYGGGASMLFCYGALDRKRMRSSRAAS